MLNRDPYRGRAEICLDTISESFVSQEVPEFPSEAPRTCLSRTCQHVGHGLAACYSLHFAGYWLMKDMGSPLKALPILQPTHWGKKKTTKKKHPAPPCKFERAEEEEPTFRGADPFLGFLPVNFSRKTKKRRPGARFWGGGLPGRFISVGQALVNGLPGKLGWSKSCGLPVISL